MICPEFKVFYLLKNFIIEKVKVPYLILNYE